MLSKGGISSEKNIVSGGQILSVAATLGSATEIDWNTGNVQIVALTAAKTLTFANPVEGGSYILIVQQDSIGSRLVTWPTIKWKAGTAPTLTTTANKHDIITLLYAGGAYYGIATLNF